MLRSEHQRVAAAENLWGDRHSVWIATSTIEAGQVIRTADVVRRDLPLASLPADAANDSPVGRRLRDTVISGEIIRSGRLSDNNSSETASQVGAGRGAIALAVAAPHLEPGDRVDLYALLSGELVAADARVIRVIDERPVIAIEQASIRAVIQAFTMGDVVPVLVS